MTFLNTSPKNMIFSQKIMVKICIVLFSISFFRMEGKFRGTFFGLPQNLFHLPFNPPSEFDRRHLEISVERIGLWSVQPVMILTPW